MSEESNLLGYELKPLPDVIDMDWIRNASELDLSIARAQGKITGGGMYARPVEPKPEKFYPTGKPEQFSRDDLKRMTPDQIMEALQAGRLDQIIGR